MIYTNHKIEFDESKCVGCQICYKACFVDVIRWDAEKRRPIFKYVEDCEHCNYCEVKCAKGAIKVRVSARPLTVTQKNRPKHNMISARGFCQK